MSTTLISSHFLKTVHSFLLLTMAPYKKPVLNEGYDCVTRSYNSDSGEDGLCQILSQFPPQ